MAVVPTKLRAPQSGASMPVSGRETMAKPVARDTMAKAQLIADEDVETAEGSSEIRSMAPLPGERDHHCTDPLWILLLLAALGVLYVPVTKALEEGDMSKYTSGFDYKGRMCGHDICDNGEVCGHFIYFCSKLGESGIDTFHPICIDSCPTSNLTSHLCYDEASMGPLLVQDWPTKEYGVKCLQRSHRLREDQEHLRKRLAGDMTRFKNAAHTPGMVLDCVASIAMARWHLLIVAFVSIAAGLMYMLFLWSFLDFLIHGSVVLVILMPTAFGVWNLFVFHNAGGIGAAVRGDSQAQEALWMGSAGVAVGFFLWCALKQILKKLDTAEGCIIATTECLFQLPFIMLEPAFSLMVKLAVVLPLLLIMFAYASTGDMKLTETAHGIRRHLQLDKEQICVILYCLFLIAWLVELIHNMTQYVLVYIAEKWYFTEYVGGRKADVPGFCVVLEATCNLFRYHLGSVIFGSLQKTLFRIPKILADGIFPFGCFSVPKHKDSNRRCSVSLMLALLGKEGYMDMAITSADYLEATEKATLTLDDSSAERVLTWTQLVFELGGLLLMTGVATLYMAVTVHSNPQFTDPASDMFLKEPDVVVILAAVLGLAVGISFMGVFDVIGDTILYCLALEMHRDEVKAQEREESGWCTGRDGNSGGFFTWMFWGEDEPEYDHHPPLRFAPTCLKELVQPRGRAR